MKDKIKIVFVVEMLAGRGGMENVTSQLINQLNLDEQFSAGLFLVNYNKNNQSSAWMGNNIWGVSTNIIRNPKITRLIHTVRLGCFLKKNKIDYVIALNTVPCLIARRAISLSRCNIPLSSWMHLPPKDRYRPQYLNLADHHFAISSEIKQQLISLGGSTDHIDVVYNPVKEIHSVIPRPDYLRFLYVGRVHFEDQKQLKDLFDAVKLLDRPWSLDIVGDGTDIQRCKDYTKSCGIDDKINWHGWQDNVWTYVENNIKEVTCLLLTSNHEGFPLVLLEAMSRGIYCVSSGCVSGPSEIIKDGINGQLYEQNNVSHLASVLTGLETGTALPAHEIIQESISVFYESIYMERFKKIIQQNLLGK